MSTNKKERNFIEYIMVWKYYFSVIHKDNYFFFLVVNKNKLLVKKELLDTMHKVIQNRILASSKILDDIQQSIDAESNSTAGDKHDTSRELMQQERNKAAQNLQSQMNLDALFVKLRDV